MHACAGGAPWDLRNSTRAASTWVHDAERMHVGVQNVLDLVRGNKPRALSQLANQQ
ncbi:MAG: hypothetical protein ACPIOQ_28485 [Promethearchaeia archaeon]